MKNNLEKLRAHTTLSNKITSVLTTLEHFLFLLQLEGFFIQRVVTNSLCPLKSFTSNVHLQAFVCSHVSVEMH